MVLSYNKEELKVNMKVYQMSVDSNRNPALIEYNVEEIIDNNKIKIKFTKEIDGSKITEEKEVNPNTVHTNPPELIQSWIAGHQKTIQDINLFIEKLNSLLINSSQKEIEI
jgi:hypothetical protein